MTNEEKLFLNYNYVKGAQRFLKEAGLVKYANEEIENGHANALAESMGENQMDVPAEGAMEDNKVLEIANALLELAQHEEGDTKAKLEEAAHEAVAAVEPAAAAPVAPVIPEEVKAASKIAAMIKKANGDVTNTDPSQVLSISDTDYTREKGKTTLDTSKGNIGSVEDKKDKNKETVVPNVEVGQNMESPDITKKNYDGPKGHTTLDTSKGQIGAEETKKLAKLAIETTLARIFNK